jgi:hypothetical protein
VPSTAPISVVLAWTLLAKIPSLKSTKTSWRAWLRINDPAFNPHADVTHEKVLKIDAAAPRVISLDIAVIYPIRSRENVRAQSETLNSLSAYHSGQGGGATCFISLPE